MAGAAQHRWPDKTTPTSFHHTFRPCTYGSAPRRTEEHVLMAYQHSNCFLNITYVWEQSCLLGTQTLLHLFRGSCYVISVGDRRHDQRWQVGFPCLFSIRSAIYMARRLRLRNLSGKFLCWNHDGMEHRSAQLRGNHYLSNVCILQTWQIM